MNAFIVHGIDGYPEENWFPWLKKELESLGVHTYVPRFPNSDKPKLNEWLEHFNEYEKYIDNNSILIGHSLGVSFILNFLEKNNKKIKAAFFVGGSIGKLNNPNFDNRNKTFTQKEFDWKKIKENCSEFFIYNSDDDPYVPLEKGKELSKYLNSKLISVKGAGHFNTKAGYTEFPLLLKDIKSIMKK